VRRRAHYPQPAALALHRKSWKLVRPSEVLALIARPSTILDRDSVHPSSLIHDPSFGVLFGVRSHGAILYHVAFP